MQKSGKKINDSTLEMLRELPLFRGADEKMLLAAVKNNDFTQKTYNSGEVIYSPREEEKRLIILKKGHASVYSEDESRSVLLRTLEPGKAVGVANLFSGEKFVSRIIAEKKCETVEITAERFGKLLECDKVMLYNYVSFLSNKICLLNKKIVYLTAGSAERKLAVFLDAHSTEIGCNSFTLPVPMHSLSEMLNLGRASLYRAADKLEADGCIKRDGKHITIVDKELMLSRYN